MYKTVVLGYLPKAKDVAESIQNEANKQEKDGFNLVTFSISPSCKPILVFYKKEKIVKTKKAAKQDIKDSTLENK